QNGRLRRGRKSTVAIITTFHRTDSSAVSLFRPPPTFCRVFPPKRKAASARTMRPQPCVVGLGEISRPAALECNRLLISAPEDVQSYVATVFRNKPERRYP